MSPLRTALKSAMAVHDQQNSLTIWQMSLPEIFANALPIDNGHHEEAQLDPLPPQGKRWPRGNPTKIALSI
jgi:hypothetical protein